MRVEIKWVHSLLWVILLVLAGCGTPVRSTPAPANGPGIDATINPAENTQIPPASLSKETTPTPKQASSLAPGSIGDVVWEDLNGNGQQDENEPGIEGVAVDLLSEDGEVILSTKTDAEGHYRFEALPPGSYALQFSYPETIFSPQGSGSDPALDSDPDPAGRTAVFSLAAAQHRSDLDAGLVYPGHAGICPLTGLPTDANLLDNRPIFISISHFPAWATRPPTGLNSAPVVFETLIDEGQTRLQALFYCGYPENIVQAKEGSPETSFDIRGVRSGRVFYAELAQLFGAGLIFGGASAEVYQEIAPYQCSTVDNTGIPKNIGDAGLNIDSLQAVAENCKHPRGNTQLDVWQFGPPSQNGEPAADLLMVYNFLNQTRWEYQPDAGGYLRYQNDPESPDEFTLSTDRLTGKAIVRQNILLLEVPHEVLNRAGTIISFDLTDERGYAWLLRDGEIQKACWSAVFNDYPTRSSRYRPFLLYDCDTKEAVNLAYGSTWINVVDPSFWLEQNGDTLTAKQPFLGYGP